MIKRLVIIAVILCFMAELTGCATIIHGTRQDVAITSLPVGAKVTIDNIEYGKTPMVIKLERSKIHRIKLELPGYRPYEAIITKNISGWAFGNIILGGWIGLAIDAVTGGIYDLSPDEIRTTLAAQDAKNISTDDMLCVFVTPNPDPTWKKIGALERIN
ncbi:MAG: PEGA domain-containing protein [Candidatus Omnitrophota bacterium]|nr:PEGA domain-containing protein [Candidatus Omnitrophota bacterium]